jgi:hypothetical protein
MRPLESITKHRDVLRAVAISVPIVLLAAAASAQTPPLTSALQKPSTNTSPQKPTSPPTTQKPTTTGGATQPGNKTPQKPTAPPPPQKPAGNVTAQKPVPPPAPQRPTPSTARGSNPIGIRGFAEFGGATFTAKETFAAVLGSRSDAIFGGGAQVLLPWGLFAEVRAWRFKREGNRVFIGPDQEVFELGIPLEVTITPFEITGGWRYQRRPPLRPPLRIGARAARLIPYGGAGFSSYRYKETSGFADDAENVDESFPGFHILGGVEYLVHRWVAVGGEVSWSSVANALGEGGASAAFREDNLGGTTFRVKVSVGR